jgi:S-adenosylmethionine:tRNA ribosyltransferase-isomerase
VHLSLFDYDLPNELIARYPPPERGASRLLVVDRASRTYKDQMFSDLPSYLAPEDCLVLNTTRVIPARLHGIRVETGAAIELFLLERTSHDPPTWRVLANPARKVKTGERIVIGGILSCIVLSEGGQGERTVAFAHSPEDFEKLLASVGEVPLPPYLNRSAEASDSERYQTIFADKAGAVAAPTAGLHFTEELLEGIRKSGVTIAEILLHVGIGTFRPVEVEEIEQHVMHGEYYEVSPEAASKVNRAKHSGKKIVAVGTTSVRTLETVANGSGEIRAGSGYSTIFVYPPYQLRVPDAILTNFHMPKSTLLMMISAFMGREFLMECYSHAIRERYRFFSYGDAMLIL